MAHGSRHTEPTGETGAPVADCVAMLRMLDPLGTSQNGSIDRKRALLADIFRLIGRRLVADPAGTPEVLPSAPLSYAVRPTVPDASVSGPSPLSPRLEQTLACLLAGNSEKEAANQLSLSRHTVHVYVKTLYRRFGVSSRAELLARHVRR